MKAGWRMICAIGRPDPAAEAATGRGMSTAAALAELGHVAEGVRSAQAVVGRARAAGVEMPIAEAVCAVLDGKLSAPQALNRLLARDPKPEAAA